MADRDSSKALHKNVDSVTSEAHGLSRRAFLRGTGQTAAGAAVLQAALTQCAPSTKPKMAAKTIGPGAVQVTMRVNGANRQLEVEPRTTLADALRTELGMTGTKVACDRGACSACTVWIDKAPVSACMTLAVDIGGREVTTVEGLKKAGELHPVQAAFIKHDAMQCGFCTPGMVMSCAALLEKKSNPSLDDVKRAVSGNLCRCGTYNHVFDATLDAAKQTIARRTHGQREG